MRQGRRVQLKKAALVCVFALLLTALAACALPLPEPTPEPTPAPTSTPTPAPTPTPTPTPAPTPTPTPTPAPEPEPEPEPTEPAVTDVNELLWMFRNDGKDARGEIARGLEALCDEDPVRGTMWTNIFQELFYVNQSILVSDTVPEGLPEDDSLCIVVFGHGLTPSGGMTAELVGRCEAALACAETYPNAYLALTGGATAADVATATEAWAMKRYLESRGVASERLILEGRSTTTALNAVYLEEILTGSYPQIKSLLVVSSTYHVPICTLVLQETALIDAAERGEMPYEVVGNLGVPFAPPSDWESSTVMGRYAMYVAQYMDVW